MSREASRSRQNEVIQVGNRMMPSHLALKLLDLIQFHRVTAVIYVAAKLGIGELLRDRPRSLDDSAKATGAERQAVPVGNLIRLVREAESRNASAS
jgi:hypothetical protein